MQEQQFPYTHQVKNDFNIQNIKSDLNEQEKIVATDLFIQYHKNVEDVNKFLNIEYAAFQNKVNNCMLQRCYKNIYNDRSQVRECVTQCTSGVQKVQDFVDRQFTYMKQDFEVCLQEKGSNFKLENAFKCYNQLNEYLLNIKVNIREEFNYYQ